MKLIFPFHELDKKILYELLYNILCLCSHNIAKSRLEDLTWLSLNALIRSRQLRPTGVSNAHDLGRF